MLIYCVDDELLALNDLEEAVKACVSENDEVLCFSRPKALYLAAQERVPDVVFSDIEMPGIKGIDLAKELNKISNRINIIFVTGYSEYSLDALDVFASGYVMKPVSEAEIKNQLEHLRYQIIKKKRIYAQTFGDFSLFVNDIPVSFHLGRSKEMLAYLIDRNGAIVSRKQIASILFEDGSYSREIQKNLASIVSKLEQDLEEVGALEIFVRKNDGYYIDRTKFDSDLFDFLSGRDTTLYYGEYMEQYSWGEVFKGKYFDFGFHEF